MAFIGAMERVRADDGPRFLVKGGVSIELRLGLRARATKDVDLVFRGDPPEMREALEEGLAQPFSGFTFRRKGEVGDIRDTGSRRLLIQLSFGGRDWQTLQVEIARPEADEIELVPVAVSISDFGLEAPEQVACLSLRYQVAQKLHAVTEQPNDRQNLRFWDIVDLLLLEELLGEDLAPLRDAAVSIFATRGTHAWPPELVIPASWREPYARTAGEMDASLPAGIDEAAQRVRQMIRDIAAA
ncbi:nucleotidyltransferase AbiEii toxin of type IV toxin-antitoxin system [Solirubrobacter pauli]|uniref:Nucleotidyltransferase AbiEii toxin of type IV toxin-antitoxin system n=1 Tax=Solirubrobacter pauli TaxID=166793 RepID=A0A660L133_9ACTN|nr:nucleotidyl transferase AbiEii/AbiGii toxin family protein [Solirubrobacter pauli]RKQ84990.1 nucleotidyltransferase AbiEii toxin of type IV toxin-antitoxin system [Solirubrobacter pauli]